MIFRKKKKRAKGKKNVFFQKISKTMDKMKSWGMSAPFLMMPVTLQGIKKHGPAKYSFFSFWWPRRPWWPRRLAMFFAESPDSCQALILTFLAIKCFLQTSVVFQRDNFKKNLYFKKRFNFAAFFGGLFVMSVQKKTFHMYISCPLITKKEKKVEKQPCKLSEKSPKFRTYFQQWRVFYNPYCTVVKIFKFQIFQRFFPLGPVGSKGKA